MAPDDALHMGDVIPKTHDLPKVRLEVAPGGQHVPQQLTRQAASDNPAFLLDYWRLNLQGRKSAVRLAIGT
jgi:hypothetical protein